MEFVIVGDRDPFLLVRLNTGESIFAESGAMVSMAETLSLEGALRGGLLSGLARKLGGGESFFTQQITAASGRGEVLLAPALPGDIQVLTVNEQTQYRLADGAFLAAEDSVILKARTQGVGKALFGGTGGFIVVETEGRGQLAICGFGSVFCEQVSEGRDLIIDNQHVVAWDHHLDYSVSVRTSQRSGLLGNLVGSATSGEGLVTRFSGNGKVYLASRNLNALRAAVGGLAVGSTGGQKTLLAQAGLSPKPGFFNDLGN